MRLLASIVVSVVASAVALIVAAVLLDDFTLKATTFPIVAILFAAILLVARATTETVVDKHAHLLSSFVGLIGAYIALLVTDIVTDGLNIEGIRTWIIGTGIIWLGMILANLILAKRITTAMVKQRREG